MTDGVHARVHDVQAQRPHPVVDRSPAKALGEELPARNRPVLPMGERRDDPIQTTNVTSNIHVMADVTFVRHAATIALRASTMTREVCRKGQAGGT